MENEVESANKEFHYENGFFMCRKKNFGYHRIHTGSELVNCEEMKKKKVGLQNEKINKFVNREREREMREKGPPTGKSCVLCEREKKHSLPSTGSKSTVLTRKRSREK